MNSYANNSNKSDSSRVIDHDQAKKEDTPAGRLQEMANNSPQGKEAAQLQKMADAHVLQKAGLSVIQKEGEDGPDLDERDKKAQVGDRHSIPHPYMNLGGWFKTLMTGRIADLFRTAGGFPGHAVQVQQEISRLNDCIDEGNFKGTAMEHALNYEQRVYDFIDSEADKVSFDLTKFVFTFSGGRTLKVERVGGVRKK